MLLTRLVYPGENPLERPEPREKGKFSCSTRSERRIPPGIPRDRSVRGKRRNLAWQRRAQHPDTKKKARKFEQKEIPVDVSGWGAFTGAQGGNCCCAGKDSLCLSRKREAARRWLIFSPSCEVELPGEGNVGAGMTRQQLGMDSGWKPRGSPNGEENGAVLGCPAGNSLGFIPRGT